MSCNKCNNNTGQYFLREIDGENMWICANCAGNATQNVWGKVEKIKTRVLMPDGKVIDGLAGIREQTRRLNSQRLTR